MMPYRSNASRSNQLDPAHTPVTDGTTGRLSSSPNTRRRRRWLFSIDSRWMTAAKRRGWLTSRGRSAHLKRPIASPSTPREKPVPDTVSVSHSVWP